MKQIANPLKRFSIFAITLFLLVAGCSILPGDSATPTPAFTPTPVTFAEDTARAFLKAWAEGDYAAMYGMVAPSRKETITADQFVTRYKGIVNEATITAVKPTFVSAHEEGNEALATFNVIIETFAAGTLKQDNSMQLRRENGRWGVMWHPGLILTELSSGGSVRFYPVASARADIYDRKSRPFTQAQELVSIEVVPVEMKNESAVLTTLSKLFGQQPGVIKANYGKYPGDWRTPIGTLTRDLVRANADALNQPGIYSDKVQYARIYPRNATAAHLIGYAGPITAEELDKLRVKGYREGDVTGKSGLEQWGEQYLAGQRGGKLVVLSSSGAITATLANISAKQSQSIYTTIDADLQEIVEKALGARAGAVVVMDVANGQVLAMASHPTFDLNWQKLSTQERRAIINNPNDPFINRAAQSAFPPGSVFKIVTYAAAVEKGGYAANSMFNDPGFWDGLGEAYRKYCWTWPITKKGHGAISLQDALTESCDVTFYQIGFKLNQIDKNLMSNFARGFGLGSETGIEIAEAPGIVPDANTPNWRAGDAVNLVIGQGTMLTSPLQIANMLAAVANGGTLYRPYLVARISSLADGTEKIIQPEVRGKLPISPGALATMKYALQRVTTDPDGTAYTAFKGSKITVAGKTGTAEVFKTGEPHSWFAGYAPVDRPRIAIAVIAEHGGEGSKTAAPIFREIVEKYFALPSK
ncbi:MAG: penicillin-binding protein 2 [Chloroflexi bacterium]|nr:penicillin-binding protein 2 [Chloroflexota bacterium]